MRKFLSPLVFFLFFAFNCINLTAQLSTKHYLPPITSSDPLENQYIYISTPKNKNVSFVIKPVGRPSSEEIVGNVSRGNPFSTRSFAINRQLYVNTSQTGVILREKGFIIEANDVIYVSVRIRSQSLFQAAAIVSKGLSALGNEFRMGGMANDRSRGGFTNFISLLATENDTKITFENNISRILVDNVSTSFPFDITLQNGESYVMSVSNDFGGNPNDLIGTLVQSDKPIVVNSGSTQGTFFNGANGRDYGIDQLVDASKTGKEYIFVRGDGTNNAWENALIIAHQNNTTIKVNGNFIIDSSGNPEVFDAGEYHVIEGDSFINDNMYVETSQNVFAFQGVGFGSNEANQGMFFVPPLNCESTGFVDQIPEIRQVGNTTFPQGGVSIVTKKGARLVIEEDSTTPTFNVVGPNNVTGNNNYVTYKVTDLSGNVTVKSLITNASGNEVATELYCSYFNRSGAATSGGFYSGFPSAPEVNFDIDITTLGNCIGNDLKLQAANTDLFDSLEWFVFDNTSNTFNTTNVFGSEYVPTVPGTYQLKGTISCSGSTFTSSNIVVSICPDDFDGDGIIDNIDVDIDNDGILNCDESLGNSPLNTTNLTNPSIVLSNNIPNNFTGTYTNNNATNSFAGDSNGDFTSTILPAFESNNEYSTNFNKEINIKITQSTSGNHTISDGEFFVVKTTQGVKNFTLLDPDNQLLVDSNFDGDYESGVTQISAREIRFKFATDLAGSASTFAFYASKISGFTFTHSSRSLSVSSTFNGNIEVTCFALDSDMDGIENAFDKDADNDGVPDIAEASATQKTLLYTDANADGLDDVFTGVTTNIDTDNDGVFNHLDRDADNDGIYDTTEAGHNLDTNFDGVLDSFVDANSNGISDNLETDTSSKRLVINYNLRDTDNDEIFNFLELDSDNDACFDVIEAGFSGNSSGFILPNPLDVDDYGIVQNSNGYRAPIDDNYITDGTIDVTNFDDPAFCELETNTIKIETNATGYQWQLSTDNGATFSNIIEDSTLDGATFTNVISDELQITDTPLSFHNYQFRVNLSRTGNSCGKTSNTVTLTVNPKPVLLNSTVNINQCADNPSEITTVNLKEAEISISTDATVSFEYYETEAKAISGGQVNQVTDEEKYPVNRTASAWARVVSSEGCYSISRINITASYAGNVNYTQVFEECDDFLDADGNDTSNNDDKDGITFFNFSSAEQDIINTFPTAIQPNITVSFYETSQDRDAAINAIPDISRHRNTNYPFNQTIYVKIKNRNNNDCEDIRSFTLQTSVIPEFEVDAEAPNDPIIICSKNIPYPLEVKNPAGNYDYDWRDENGNAIGGNQSSISVSNAGRYTVRASSRNSKVCTRERTIVVQKSDFGVLDDSFVTVSDETNGGNNLSIRIDIPVNPLINEEFQYALEDENGNRIRALQDSNVFNNIEGGIYNIIVENKNGCGTSELLVSVIQFPKFFTPNGDGKNDRWFIKGVSNTFYNTANISIFNRFGKLVAKVTTDSQGWNGRYNGKELPPDDYWYSIQLIPVNPTKQQVIKKGHFSLLRR